MDDPIQSLEKLLTKTGLSVTPQEQRKLLRLAATTPYSEKRIVKFIERNSLSVNDAIECIEISSIYGARLDKVSQLLDSGYSVETLSDFMELREEVLPDTLNPRKFLADFGSGEVEFWPPDLSEYISYQNMIFLDEMSGGAHDVGEIRNLLSQIDERIDEARTSIGAGVIVHRMRQIYEAQKSSGEVLTFDTLLNRALCYIPREFHFDRGE